MSAEVDVLADVEIDVRVLGAGLQQVGWELRDVEVDLVAGHIIVYAHRFDGRWLYLRVRESAVIERWHRDEVMSRFKGGPQFASHEDRFLGSTRYDDVHAATRALCQYIAQNPSPGFPSMTMNDVQRMFTVIIPTDSTADRHGG